MLMNDLLTRDEMAHLKKTDFEQYKKEIARSWITQDADIAKIKSIMATYDQEQAKRDLVVGGKKFPIWAIDAYQYFDAKYGSQFGCVILEKVLSKVWGDLPQELVMP